MRILCVSQQVLPTEPTYPHGTLPKIPPRSQFLLSRRRHWRLRLRRHRVTRVNGRRYGPDTAAPQIAPALLYPLPVPSCASTYQSIRLLALVCDSNDQPIELPRPDQSRSAQLKWPPEGGFPFSPSHARWGRNRPWRRNVAFSGGVSPNQF